MEEETKGYTLEESGSIITQVVDSSSEQQKRTESTGNTGQGAQAQGAVDYTGLSKQQEAPQQADWGAVGQAIGSLFGAIMGGQEEPAMSRADRLAQYETPSARQNSSGYTSQMDTILRQDTVSGPGTPGQSGATGSMSSSVGGENVNRPVQAFKPSGDALRDGIIETASALDMDPVDLATAISYETAGTFNPTKRGPTTQWGQHRGLIQFGEPQAKKYGVDFSSGEAALKSQLGKDGAIVKYLKASGFKNGMSGLDLYSTINAGAPGRYRASDANNGGAWGSVADKWSKQMGAHRKKAMKLLGL